MDRGKYGAAAGDRFYHGDTSQYQGIETAENAVPMPNLPEMDVMWTVASGLLTDVNMAGNDVAESAEKAQKEALQLIESMK